MSGENVTAQLKMWEGEFGEAYTARNKIDWRIREPAFRSMLAGLPVKRVFEVGCNRGHNLIALTEVLGADSEVAGVEPNEYACNSPIQRMYTQECCAQTLRLTVSR